MAKITFDELLYLYDPIDIEYEERFREVCNEHIEETAYKVVCEGEGIGPF